MKDTWEKKLTPQEYPIAFWSLLGIKKFNLVQHILKLQFITNILFSIFLPPVAARLQHKGLGVLRKCWPFLSCPQFSVSFCRVGDEKSSWYNLHSAVTVSQWMTGHQCPLQGRHHPNQGACEATRSIWTCGSSLYCSLISSCNLFLAGVSCIPQSLWLLGTPATTGNPLG